MCNVLLMCRHCEKHPVNRPRGLCWPCYYTPGIREQYPSTSKFARRGAGLGCKGTRLPAEPTSATPGSAEKVAVLEQRFARGECLWHPDDVQGCREPPPWAPPLPIFGRPHRSRLAFVEDGDVLLVA
jgi:hypothetical protein